MPHYRQHDLNSDNHWDIRGEHVQDGNVLVWRADITSMLEVFPGLVDLDLPNNGSTDDLNNTNDTIEPDPHPTLDGYWIPEEQTGTGTGNVSGRAWAVAVGG